MVEATKRETRPSYRREVVEALGTKCHFCDEDATEYHHMIPLAMGGEESIRNLIPVCDWHHMLLHGAFGFRRRERIHKGRTRQCDKVEGYKDVLDDYFHCRIGTSECKELLGLKETSALKDIVWVKEYINEAGIEDYRNNIDIIRSYDRRKGRDSSVHDETYITHENGTAVGWVKYSSGDKEEFYWKDVKNKKMKLAPAREQPKRKKREDTVSLAVRLYRESLEINGNG